MGFNQRKPFRKVCGEGVHFSNSTRKKRKKGSFVRKLRVHWRIHATATVSRTISTIGDHATWIIIGLIRPHLLDEEEVEHWGEAMDEHPVQNFEG